MPKTNKVISSISYPFAWIVKFFKKIKLDNFVGGLIVGAIFSLLVNVLTVQIQEGLAKQRALEAVEREIAQHYVDTSLFFDENDFFKELESEGETLYYPEVFYLRMNTNIWESGEAMKYIFELDPTISSDLAAYYETAVKITNNSLGRIQSEFDESFNIYCRPSNVLRDSDFKPNKRYCNSLILETYDIFASVHSTALENALMMLDEFHPTQDRLDSFWKRLLLGGNSVEMLKEVQTL